MFDSSWWWTFANKLGNFTILCGGCWYLAKKHLVPYIKEECIIRTKELSDLDSRSLQLIQERDELLAEIAVKKVSAQVLLLKIEQWKQAMIQKELVYDVERKAQEKKCNEYLKMRADGLCHELLKEQVFPQVVAQTRQEVMNIFKSDVEKKKYQQIVLKSLKKDNAHG